MRKPGAFCLVLTLFLLLGGCAGVFAGNDRGPLLSPIPASIEEVWKIKDEYDFVTGLTMYVDEKCDYGRNMDALSHAEQVFYIAQTLDMEVGCGGFWQYLFNVEADVYCNTVSAVSEIGAPQTAALCQKAFSAFDEELPRECSGRRLFLSKIGMEECYELLSEFDEAFYTYDEDLTALAYAYAQAYADAFS